MFSPGFALECESFEHLLYFVIIVFMMCCIFTFSELEAKQRAELTMRNIQLEMRAAQNTIKEVCTGSGSGYCKCGLVKFEDYYTFPIMKWEGGVKGFFFFIHPAHLSCP